MLNRTAMPLYHREDKTNKVHHTVVPVVLCFCVQHHGNVSPTSSRLDLLETFFSILAAVFSAPFTFFSFLPFLTIAMLNVSSNKVFF